MQQFMQQLTPAHIPAINSSGPRIIPPKMDTCPVFMMMKKEDQYDICLVAIMDMMLKNLIDRNRKNNSRKDRYKRILDLLTDTEHTYEGSLPDAMVNKAEKFNRMICSDLSTMTKLIKEK